MSLLGKIMDKAPVPYTSRWAAGNGLLGRASSGSQTDALATMGGVGTVFSIVNRTSTATASVEWGLYRKGADGLVPDDDERTPVAKHAALDLWRNPNPFMTTNELMETVQQWVDLVGEGSMVLVKAAGIPLEIWPVRPDRLHPVPHPTKFLAGYVYLTPDGEKIPLAVDEVLRIKLPNPLDPYRGLGPVQSILTDLDSVRYSAEWNRNFFLNSAEPGGIIEIPDRLSDDEFAEMQMRWNEQHKGVSRAHRVAIIEHGKYVPRAFSMRDMQFAELRQVGRDTIMEAFGVSKPMLGITDDVNRANAEASIFMFDRHLTVPRLNRWRQMLNARLLPMFGGTGKGVGFDYDSPVDEDGAALNMERDSKVAAAVALLGVQGVKFDVDEVLEAFDLPPISWEEPETPPALDPAAAPGAPGVDPAETPPGGGDQGQPRPPGGNPPANVRAEHEPEHDLGPQADAWQTALDRLLEQWATVGAGQRAELARQIADAIDSDDLAALADLSVESDTASMHLLDALVQLHRTSAAQAAAEAQAQGAEVPPAEPDAEALGAVAVSVAALLAAGLAVAAGREALRRHDGTKSGDDVAAEVDAYLRELSDRPQRDALGGALTGTQNRARIDTWKSGPVGSFYADERLDSNTCGPCRAINGRFIATTEDPAALDLLYTPWGGYIDCEGGVRCRGTVTGVWRPTTVEDE